MKHSGREETEVKPSDHSGAESRGMSGVLGQWHKWFRHLYMIRGRVVNMDIRNVRLRGLPRLFASHSDDVRGAVADVWLT